MFCPRFSSGFSTRQTWRTRAVQMRRIRSNSPFDRWWFVWKSHAANSRFEAIIQYRLRRSASNTPAILHILRSYRTPSWSALDIALETLSPRVDWSLPMIIRAITTWGNMLNPRVIIWNSRLSPGFSWNWKIICHVLWYITLWPPILVFLFKNLSILLFFILWFFFSR